MNIFAPASMKMKTKEENKFAKDVFGK